jgi:CTP synthase (UTP-ammonia lyase)
MAKKYIVVAGGVISGIGKGVIGQYHHYAAI